MARYNKTKIKRNNPKVNSVHAHRAMKYNTTLYEKIPVLDSDIQITTQEGDRLDNISMTFYDTPRLWWYIARANNLTSINVPAGLDLRIPVSVNYAKGK